MQDTPGYMDTSRSFTERVDDLVSRMTIEEKVSQMIHPADAIERLGVPQYNWWNECLHGVGRAGIATVFPQAIGIAATWNTDLMQRTATAIADEARAKHHEAARNGSREQYEGLNFWTPNINIFRDPRWGRGQETYGEDPYLTARMGVTFVRTLQGDDPKYYKVTATPKHFAVHSGPEDERHGFDAIVSEKELWETYLPAFKACVVEAKAESVMGAYNRTNGEPCCASPTLLEKILREEWGFQGHIVSDCGAIADIWEHHKVVSTPEEAAALAVKTGCDLNCGETYPALVKAYEQGLIDEATIDVALKRLFMARFRLGMFDPPEDVPYAQIPYEVNDCAEHRDVARVVAQESIVLLKNAEGMLPLNPGVSTLAVIGPKADDVDVLLGNYNGTPSKSVTILQGIRDGVSSGTTVSAVVGDDIFDTRFDEAVSAVESADVAILVLGLSQDSEGEEGDGGDRRSILLPEKQQKLLRAVCGTGTPVVLVILSGSAIALPWADEHAPAILYAWYPGEEGGTAVADVLFGRYNPAGRLPVTVYRDDSQLPEFRDYSMEGRTYRFMREEPLYPFGYGLSYTTFEYTDLMITPDVVNGSETVSVTAVVKNTGGVAGDEVVQLYVTDVEASVKVPVRQLQGFMRIHLKAGESRQVAFELTPERFSLITEDARRIVEPGEFRISVGGGQPVARTQSLVLEGSFTVTGDVVELKR